MAVETRYRSPARLINMIVFVIVAFLVIGIVLVLLKANGNNQIVDFFIDVGGWFAKPFQDLLPQHDPRINVLVNWGIAALAYLIVGALLTRLIRRI